MRNSLCCSLVEYSYKINFWCFRALFVPGRQSHFLFVNLLVTGNWVNLFLLLLLLFFEKRKMSVLRDIWEMSLAACRTIFSPVPFIPKLHQDFFDCICLICHSPSTRCSDNAEHVWIPLLWFFLFTHHFFSLRSGEFLSAFQDIWEHLKIIISKWSSNEGKGFCQIFAWELRVLAVMLHFICRFVPCQTCYRCCWSLTYAIIIGWAQGMQIAQDLLKCILKGLQMSVPKSNYHFLSLNLSFFCQPFFNFPCSWKRSDGALHLWRRIFISCGKLPGI